MDKKIRVTVEMDEVLYQSMMAAVQADPSGKSKSQFVRSAISEKIYRIGKTEINDL